MFNREDAAEQEKMNPAAGAEAEAAEKETVSPEEAAEAEAKGDTEQADPAEAINNMAAQLLEKDKQLEEAQNRLLRLQADFDNFRRRNAEERRELSLFVTADVVEKFLHILDNFERAQETGKQATDPQSILDGMASIQKQFLKTLEDLDVKEIPAEGQPFDPNVHEAVMRGQNPDLPDDTIDMVFQKGYQVQDRVIRHSKVRVIGND